MTADIFQRRPSSLPPVLLLSVRAKVPRSSRVPMSCWPVQSSRGRLLMVIVAASETACGVIFWCLVLGI